MKSEDIKFVKRLRNNGASHAEIARLTGLSPEQINFACNTGKQARLNDPSPDEIAERAARMRANNMAIPKYYIVVPKGLK